MKKRIVVAMSGGVDSSATAALLIEQGWDVVGVTMQLYDHGQAVGRANTCCAGKDIRDARRVADALGIPHYVLNYENRFAEEVILPFAQSYARGETPIPCIDCNRTVKFRDLIGLAREVGAEALATGHYVRREEGSDGPVMLRGADPVRDQSYFLFATTREQLGFLRFPLGAMAGKDETRAIARRFDLPVATKPDSQDICFVPSGHYASLVARLTPEAMAPGEIVDLGGQVLGRHDGIGNFTVGQRKGLGLGGGDPLYVIRLEAATRRVVVGPRAALATNHIAVRDVNWLGEGDAVPGRAFRAAVKVRSTRGLRPATVTLGEGMAATVDLDDPEEGVSPGQACVFYDGERLLGGGWITARCSP